MPSGKKSKKSKVRIDVRLDPNLLQGADAWCRKQKIRVTRTAVIEAALHAFLEIVPTSMDVAKRRSNMDITKATVVRDRYATDKVFLTTTLPSPTPLVPSGPCTFTFDVERGRGVEYVREHFRVEPELVEVDGAREPFQEKASK